MTNKKTIVIKENSYEIEFPRVGQFQDIELLKASLSKGYYRVMSSVGTTESDATLNMIDTEAYLTILIPKLKDDLKVKSFGDLGIMDMLELEKVYRKDIMPWIKEIREMIKKFYSDNISTEIDG